MKYKCSERKWNYILDCQKQDFYMPVFIELVFSLLDPFFLFYKYQTEVIIQKITVGPQMANRQCNQIHPNTVSCFKKFALICKTFINIIKGNSIWHYKQNVHNEVCFFTRDNSMQYVGWILLSIDLISSNRKIN